MTRRRAPRPASSALRTALERARPQTRLATLQSEWARIVGERFAAAAQPVAEHDGAVVISCVDSVWAEELDLMQQQLLIRLRDQLGKEAPQSLRFRVKDGRDQSHL